MSRVLVERLFVGAFAIAFIVYDWQARRTGKVNIGPGTFDRTTNPQGFKIGIICNWICIGFTVLCALIAN